MGSIEPIRVIDYAVVVTALLLCADVFYADQGGSFWFPGQFGSLAAVQQAPGWALSVNIIIPTSPRSVAPLRQDRSWLAEFPRT